MSAKSDLILYHKWPPYALFCCNQIYKKEHIPRHALRGQTVLSAHYKRNPQQAKIRFVAESETSLFSLIFYAVLDSTIPKTMYRSKLLQK